MDVEIFFVMFICDLLEVCWCVMNVDFDDFCIFMKIGWESLEF